MCINSSVMGCIAVMSDLSRWDLDNTHDNSGNTALAMKYSDETPVLKRTHRCVLVRCNGFFTGR